MRIWVRRRRGERRVWAWGGGGGRRGILGGFGVEGGVWRGGGDVEDVEEGYGGLGGLLEVAHRGGLMVVRLLLAGGWGDGGWRSLWPFELDFERIDACAPFFLRRTKHESGSSALANTNDLQSRKLAVRHPTLISPSLIHPSI